MKLMPLVKLDRKVVADAAKLSRVTPKPYEKIKEEVETALGAYLPLTGGTITGDFDTQGDTGIGNADGDKIGLYGVTKIVRQDTITDAVTSHNINSTFSDTEVEATLDALGTKINLILVRLENIGINKT